MIRATYRRAIEWLAMNEDLDTIRGDYPPITVLLVADLFDKDELDVRRDVLSLYKRRMKGQR